MTAAKSSKSRRPEKPYPEFPLWPNTNGQWSKKIRGRLYNFGVWSDPEIALKNYQLQVDDLQFGDGRAAVGSQGDPTLRDAINKFLRVQKADMHDGEISPEHFDDLLRTWQNIIPTVIDLGLPLSNLKPDHFRHLKKRFSTKRDGTDAAAATMKGHIARVKILFRWLVAEGVLDREPAYGAKFGKLSTKQKQASRTASLEKEFTRDEILSLLQTSDDGANYRIRAMVLLGVNAGMGPRDIAELRFDQLDLDGGWLVGQRSRSAVRRCAKLWPETVKALKLVTEKRFDPVDDAHAELVFITRMKRAYLNKGAISRIFAKLKIKAGIKGTNQGFYVLRHVCRDVASQQRDDTASRWIMGYKSSTMDDQYAKHVPRDRIDKVCDHIRSWLFEGGSNEPFTPTV